MKKALYIIGIVAVLLICGSTTYYFITRANIEKQEFNIKNEKYIQERSKACKEEFREYYEYNNYDKSMFYDDGDYLSDYGQSEIKYSMKTNSCIQYFYSHHKHGDFFEDKYKIADETNRKSLYVCIHSTYYDNDGTTEECEDGYNKKLKELGLKN